MMPPPLGKALMRAIAGGARPFSSYAARPASASVSVASSSPPSSDGGGNVASASVAVSSSSPLDGGACALGRPGLRCLLDAEIQTLVDVYNERVGEKEKLPTRKSVDQLLAMLGERVGCDGEECTICRMLEVVRGTEYEPIVLRIKEMAFKVEGPESLNALLDNFLIIRICRQLSSNYPGVRFGGVLTIDFMIPPLSSPFGDPKAVWKDFSSTKWGQFQLVLNVDHRMGTGQHWTALIVDAEAKEIQYFDSYGMPPTDGILSGSRPYPGIADEQGRFLSLLRNWINDVRLLFVEHGIAMKFVYNTTCHQARRDQSNCGPYSLLFLALRSKGMSFSSITKEVITTKEIEELRGKMYKRVKDYRPVPPLDAL